jgi:hypothetical protein
MPGISVAACVQRHPKRLPGAAAKVKGRVGVGGEAGRVIKIRIRELRNNFFGLKILLFLDADLDPGSGNLFDPGSGMEKFKLRESGINIPDPYLPLRGEGSGFADRDSTL